MKMNYKYEIIDPEVQEAYYYVKKRFDSEGLGPMLDAYLAGYSGKIKIRKNFITTFASKLIFLIPLPLTPFIFIGGIILMIFKHFFLGLVMILVPFVLHYLQSKTFSLEAQITEDFQVRRLKLMKLVAQKMSKGASEKEIFEASRSLIETVLKRE